MEDRCILVVGNPRKGSRTLQLGNRIAASVSAAAGLEFAPQTDTIDLAEYGQGLIDPAGADATAVVDWMLRSACIVVACPVYKATFPGIFKLLCDATPSGAFGGRPVLPVMVGGGPHHSLAVECHLVPLLYELGATVPVGGRFILESDMNAQEHLEWASMAGAAVSAIYLKARERGKFYG